MLPQGQCPWFRLVRVEFCRCCITSSLHCIDKRMYTCTGFQSYMSQLLHICIVIVFSVTIVVLFMNIIIIPVVRGSVSPLSPGADLNKTAIKGSAKGKRSVCSYSRKNINGNRAKNLSRTVLPSVFQSWSREWFRGLLVGLSWIWEKWKSICWQANRTAGQPCVFQTSRLERTTLDCMAALALGRYFNIISSFTIIIFPLSLSLQPAMWGHYLSAFS